MLAKAHFIGGGTITEKGYVQQYCTILLCFLYGDNPLTQIALKILANSTDNAGEDSEQSRIE